ncbi:MAG: restriction endonuclease subunit S [Thermoleophilia bacterium]
MTDSLLGALPAEWEITTLGEVCARGGGDIQTGPFGSQLHASDYVPVGVPSIMPQNIGDNRIVTDGIARISEGDAARLRRYLVRSGDIVYSRRGDVERRALVRDEQVGWLCGTGCLRVRLGEGVAEPSYAAYYLAHPAVREWIVQHAVGATMPNLNTAILSAVPFALPPLAAQRRIAHILSALDDKIELNRRMNRTLEAIARDIFKSWFVDFDPVRRKMEGGKLGQPPDVAACFPASFEESAIGFVPRDWPVVRLSALADINPTYPLTRGSIVPYVEMSGLPTDAARITQWRYREYTSGSRFRNSDVLVARITPCLENGKTALVDFLERGATAWGSTEFLVMRPRGFVPTEYVYCLSRSVAFRDYAVGSMNGSSGRQRVPAEALDRLLVVKPPDRLLEAFGEVTGSELALMRTNDRQSQALAELRDILLPRLLSGAL